MLAEARELLRGGHLGEARDALGSLAACARECDSTAMLIECMALAAVVEATDGHADRGWMEIERAAELAERETDHRGIALVHITRATLFEIAGRLDDFEREARAGRRAADGLRDPSLVARADMALAVAASVHGDASAALLRYGSAMANFSAAGDEFFAAVVQCNIGAIHIETSEPLAALEHLEPAVETLSRVGGPLYIALSLLATALACLGRAPDAVEVSVRALSSATGFGRRALSWAYNARGAACLAAGDRLSAVSYYTIAEGLALSVDGYNAGDAAEHLGSLFAEADRLGESFSAIDRGSRFYDQLNAKGALTRLLDRLNKIRSVADSRIVQRIRQVDGKTASPGHHSEVVSAHAVELAERLGIPPFERHWLAIGALLHDVGYSSLLLDALGSSAMTPGQRSVLELHCTFGDELLAREGYPAVIRQIVRHHHERWDGDGYPDRLAGEAIPLLARITAIAERWTALRSPRGARPGLDRQSSLARLRAEAGSGFDPALVDVFVAMIEGSEDVIELRGGRNTASHRAVADNQAWDAPARIQQALGITYVLGAELQGGGMSRLFRARDPLLEREVVVKVLPPEQGEDAAKRFRREMSIAANLAHPRILPILHAGLAGTLPYYVMPFIKGGSVRDQLRFGPMEVPFALSLLRDVAEALGHAHQMGVVHRDIKPGNVLLQDGRALVADFGIARQSPGTSDAPSLTLTDTGEAIGTVGYMAPEQLLGDGQPAPTMDVYSFGVLAFEMLTGAPPFSASTMNALMFAHITKEAVSVASLAPSVPEPVAALVDASLRKSANERPRDGSALLIALG